VKKFKDYESAVGRLEEITNLLESGDSGLEQSLQLYIEGVEIAKLCDEKLNQVAKSVKIISEENGMLEKDFKRSADEDES